MMPIPGTPPTIADRYRVLIVDDEPEVRAYARECLAALPYVDVTLAASGEEAIAAMREGWFDLILSDERMGTKTDGVATLEAAKRLAPDAPRVLMTGFGDLSLTEEAVNRAHVTRFLPKPFLPEALVDIVAPLLTARRSSFHRRVAFDRVAALALGREQALKTS